MFFWARSLFALVHLFIQFLSDEKEGCSRRLTSTHLTSEGLLSYGNLLSYSKIIALEINQ